MGWVGSSIRWAGLLPAWSERDLASILFQSKRTRVGSIASGMAKLPQHPRIRLNTQPDAMHKKRRDGRDSSRTSVEDEIGHLRGLGLTGLRARWHGVFQRQAPPHLTRHLLFAVVAYRLQVDRLGDLDHETKQVLDRTVEKEAGAVTSARLASFYPKQKKLIPRTGLVPEWG